MRKLIFALALCLIPTIAFAQNTTCSDRPAGDSSNACANTRFVQNHVPSISPSNITLPDGQIIIGDSSGEGHGRTMSGDCTITDLGAITCSTPPLPTIADGHLIANATGSTAIAGDTIATTWFDHAFCSTVGQIVARTTSGWICSAGIAAPVTWFGAKCDGTTDDRAAIISALAAIPSGSTLEFPSTVCAVKSLTSGGTNPHIFVLTKPVHLSFPNGGGISKSGVIGILFDIQTDNVTIDGSGTLDGGWVGTAYSAYDIAVSTNDYDTVSTARNYIRIKGINFTNWAQGGIFIWYCQSCTIEDNVVNNVAYGGIFGGAIQQTQIIGNKVYNVWSSTGPDQPPNPVYRSNHYGISVSTNLATTSPSLNVIVANNLVDNVPAWECYDTHSGQHVIFANNIATACPIGIAASSPNLTAIDISIIGNQVECLTLGSPVYSGSTGQSVGGAGISAAGNSGASLSAGVSIVGNIVLGCGPDNLALEGNIGAIYATFVAGLNINSNIIYKPIHVALSFTGDYVLGAVMNNTVQSLTAGPAGGSPEVFNIFGTNNMMNLGGTYANGTGYVGYNIASASAANVNISRSNVFNGASALYNGSSATYRTDLGVTAP